MKVRKIYKILAILVAIFGAGVLAPQAFAKNVNDFYFDGFAADYYLSKDADGVAHMKVKETLTAVFPEYEQNKGIYRRIPFMNKNGRNLTLPSLTERDIKITRNGQPEPIYDIEETSSEYKVSTGTEEYVLGKQVYTFEYNFENVISEFSHAAGNTGYAYQELYWDTNGTGWSQKFNRLTATVHFESEEIKNAFTGKTWCYVGSYGEKGSERCEITDGGDWVRFSTGTLSAGENLTFDIEFRPGAFAVRERETSYFLVAVEAFTAIVCVVLLFAFPIRKFLKVTDKRRYYKDYFIVPEYQPHKDYSVAEMAKIYMGKTKEVKVAVLLDMIVKKKIEFIKTKDNKIFRDKWAVKILDVASMDENEKILIKTMNAGDDFKKDDTIEVKSHTATPKLVSLWRSFDSETISRLKTHGLIGPKSRAALLARKDSQGRASWAVMLVFAVATVWMMHEILDGVTPLILSDKALASKDYVGEGSFNTVMMIILMAAGLIKVMFREMTSRYECRTMKGLAASRYMDGLKLYISMAEADRIKFLQSKDKVDVSPDGVVKLYEKLLPYAALLGLEKSWMKELEKYYKEIDIKEQPDWYRSGLTVNDLFIVSTLSSSSVSSSTTIYSGSSSSGFSGGGGGGFSGGGGGGGGGGGR